MFKLSKSKITIIEKFVSYPSGLGYVLDFSDREFSEWFDRTWRVSIDDVKYQDRGTSKRHRLISFCLQSGKPLVLAVLGELKDRSQQVLEIKENPAPSDLYGAFSNIIHDLREEVRLQEESNVPRQKDVPNPVKYSKATVIANITENAVALSFIGYSLLEQIAAYRETVRSNNQLGAKFPEFRDELIEFLDRLYSGIESLFNYIPKPTEAPSEVQGEKAKVWTDRFVGTAIPEWEKYLSPEKLGEASAPVGIILGCGAIGALLTGFNPVGFGVGSLIGKFITGEVKSGVVADKMIEQIRTGTSEED